MRFRDRLRQAFAIPAAGEFVPSANEQALVDRLVGLMQGRGLAVPAILFLDSVAPLHAPAAQALHFLSPLARLLPGDTDWDAIAALVERPGGLEYLLRRLERPPQSPTLPPAVASAPDPAPERPPG